MALNALVLGHRLDSVIPEVFSSLTLGSFPSSDWLLWNYPRKNPQVVWVRWKEVCQNQPQKGTKGEVVTKPHLEGEAVWTGIVKEGPSTCGWVAELSLCHLLR